jgi:hypothetical protein
VKFPFIEDGIFLVSRNHWNYGFLIDIDAGDYKEDDSSGSIRKWKLCKVVHDDSGEMR